MHHVTVHTAERQQRPSKRLSAAHLLGVSPRLGPQAGPLTPRHWVDCDRHVCYTGGNRISRASALGDKAQRLRAAARLVQVGARIHRLVGARQPPPAALTPTLRQGYEERS